jgi:hypothetical protein
VLTAPPLLDDAERLAASSIEVIGHAPTSSAWAIGLDDEAAMVRKAGGRTGVPVASSCASAVLAHKPPSDYLNVPAGATLRP